MDGVRVLSFDCYGTLIDWEAGLHAAFAPLRARLPSPPPTAELLSLFARLQAAQEEETPRARYRDLLAVVHDRVARELGAVPDGEESRAFGASIGDWPAFADTVEALRALKSRFALVVLSNVDRESFAATNLRLGVTFDAVCTAEDIGSYKPDPRNFDYLLCAIGRLGYGKSDLLHVAQSLYHDHVPAQRAGIRSAWIDRYGAAGRLSLPADARYDLRCTSLAELADRL